MHRKKSILKEQNNEAEHGDTRTETGTAPDLTNLTGYPYYDTQYNGLTGVFTLHVDGLGSGLQHIEVVIADAGDKYIDSGVFLQTGSLSATPMSSTPVSTPTTLLLLGIGLMEFRLNQKRQTIN